MCMVRSSFECFIFFMILQFDQCFSKLVLLYAVIASFGNNRVFQYYYFIFQMTLVRIVLLFLEFSELNDLAKCDIHSNALLQLSQIVENEIDCDAFLSYHGDCFLHSSCCEHPCLCMYVCMYLFPLFWFYIYCKYCLHFLSPCFVGSVLFWWGTINY